LLAIEDGRLHEFKGKSLDSIDATGIYAVCLNYSQSTMITDLDVQNY
jgi:ribosomal protein L5